ncbi:calcineurin-like phosphoesterase family protein [Brevibacterium sanguinis]|uniref:Calcineurin-like phosphoesterase family protein n=2 Tax=Brevibacterium TaxID=1696 RepID=A0A366ICR7_9MICO|nr:MULTISPECIES: metallophosphoesterase family protein [Brevibacterium]RBP62344.1 calcineurin-like phosphoesterase family protein [Brevibacterium sanguinis]RBP68733.1 calcineurin-like phosphoesterase family protein [Brevibacterium celere]
MSVPRRITALVVLLASLAVITLPWAVLSARADLTFGPHEARYEVTADSRLTVDFGPLGKLLMPAEEHLPAGLGLTVEVGEIPVSGDRDEESRAGASQRRAGAAEGQGTVDALGADVASYALLFSSPQTQIDQIVIGLTRDILTRWALAVCVLSGAATGAALAFGPLRARDALRVVAGRELVAAGLVVVTVFGVVGIAVLNRPQPVVGDPAFDGTPLEGAQVTGRLGGVIGTAVGAVKDFADDNDAFYDGVLAHLDEQWDARPQTGNWSDRGLVPVAGAEAGRADVSTFVFGSDIHCNIGMARVVGDVARRTGADAYIDGGDITMTGTSAENYCFDVLDQELPESIPKITVKGNHDSTETTDHAARSGWEVLENSTAELAGVTFFGGPDPRRTVFGSGPELETGMTAEQYAQALRAEACETEFDIMLIHDARIAAPSLRSGCAEYSLSGHWHRRVGPEALGSGVRYVSSTTGGALANALTPGPLKMDAELSIIRIDNRTKRPIDLQVITVGEDQSLRIGPWTRFPAPIPLVGQPPEGDAEGS